MQERWEANSAGSYGEDDAIRASTSEVGVCVTVISTTLEGTQAALTAARSLGKGLAVHITLLALDVGTSKRPSDSAVSVPGRQRFSLPQSCSRQEDVTVLVYPCRDVDSGLRSALGRRALVVIGGRRRWWSSREEKVERALRRLGHHIIFIEIDSGKSRGTHRPIVSWRSPQPVL
jgi:hypothetical protein